MFSIVYPLQGFVMRPTRPSYLPFRGLWRVQLDKRGSSLRAPDDAGGSATIITIFAV